jgi:hypothetical protein
MAVANAIESTLSPDLQALEVRRAITSAEQAVEGAAGLLRGFFGLAPGADAWDVDADATMNADALAGVEMLLQTASDRLSEAQAIVEPNEMTEAFRPMREAIVLAAGLAQLLRSAAVANGAESLRGFAGAAARDLCERIAVFIAAGRARVLPPAGRA